VSIFEYFVGDDLFVTVSGSRELKPAIPGEAAVDCCGMLSARTISIHSEDGEETRSYLFIFPCGRNAMHSANGKIRGI
jgi:hypothetical protein